MIYFGLVFVALCLAFLLQDFVPAVAQARLLLVHAVFFSTAVTVPYPVMLLFAFLSGFAWDALYHVPKTAGGELDFGFTILLFGLLGSLIQGIRPLFRRGRWELPVLMVGIAIFLTLMIEHLVICFHRGGLRFPTDVWFKMLVNSLFAILLSPLLLILLSWTAKRTGYRIRMDGITNRKLTYGNEI